MMARATDRLLALVVAEVARLVGLIGARLVVPRSLHRLINLSTTRLLLNIRGTTASLNALLVLLHSHALVFQFHSKIRLALICILN